MHIATADAAPGFHDLTREIAAKFGTADVVPESITMNDWNSDWDVLYPFSAVR